MSTGSDREAPAHGMSTWSIERLQAFTTDAHDRRQLEAARVVAQHHAYYSDQPREVRRQWAKLSLLANRRMHGDGPGDPTREVQQDFMLRMWVIEHLGRDDKDPDWSPARLAADTLDVLALTPSDAGALGGNWRELPIEQIRGLRRHKNLTAHLERLLGHLQPGLTRDQLLLEIRGQPHRPHRRGPARRLARRSRRPRNQPCRRPGQTRPDGRRHRPHSDRGRSRHAHFHQDRGTCQCHLKPADMLRRPSSSGAEAGAS